MSSETAASAPSAPPSVFSTGARVSTQYGLGEITGVRWAPDGITAEFYEVKLEYGRAVLTSSCVSAADVTLDELIAAADASRAAGNARYKERDYDTALLNYRLATAAFREETGAFKGVITDAQKRAMRDSIVKSLSNMAMVYIAKGEPSSLAEAIAVAGHALEMDPLDVTLQREKLLYRRGVAQLRLKKYDEAIVDLSDPVLVKNKEAQDYLAKARESLKRAVEKNSAFWSSAFKKAASSPGEENPPPDSPTTPSRAATATSGVSSSAPSSAGGKRVTESAGGTDSSGTSPSAKSMINEDDDSSSSWPFFFGAGVAVLALGWFALRYWRKI